MKKKIVGIFVMTLLIATAYSTVGLEENTSSLFNNSIEVEDQKVSGGGGGVHYTFSGEIVAQGFTPALSTLTKVLLKICKCGTPPEHTNLTVAIRETYDGDDIVSNTVYLDDITEFPLEVVFPETDLTIDVMYYIVCSTDKAGGMDEGTHYGWNFLTSDPYERGDSWEYVNNNWYLITYQGGIDFGFTTYCMDYVPDACEIDGPTDGKAQEFTYYDFCTNDPEGHDVEYYIEWGDGLVFNWFGPYESGEIATKGHSWASKGNYTISVKARDSYGAESELTELEISMPKAKTTNSPFITFLENHPRLFPLIRHSLELFFSSLH